MNLERLVELIQNPHTAATPEELHELREFCDALSQTQRELGTIELEPLIRAVTFPPEIEKNADSIRELTAALSGHLNTAIIQTAILRDTLNAQFQLAFPKVLEAQRNKLINDFLEHKKDIQNQGYFAAFNIIRVALDLDEDSAYISFFRARRGYNPKDVTDTRALSRIKGVSTLFASVVNAGALATCLEFILTGATTVGSVVAAGASVGVGVVGLLVGGILVYRQNKADTAERDANYQKLENSYFNAELHSIRGLAPSAKPTYNPVSRTDLFKKSVKPVVIAFFSVFGVNFLLLTLASVIIKGVVAGAIGGAFVGPWGIVAGIVAGLIVGTVIGIIKVVAEKKKQDMQQHIHQKEEANRTAQLSHRQHNTLQALTAKKQITVEKDAVIAAKQEQVDTIAAELAAKQTVLAETAAKLVSSTAESTAKNADLEAQKAALDALAAKLAATEAELAEKKAKSKARKQELLATQAKLEDKTVESETLQQQLERQQKEKEALEKESLFRKLASKAKIGSQRLAQADQKEEDDNEGESESPHTGEEEGIEHKLH